MGGVGNSLRDGPEAESLCGGDNVRVDNSLLVLKIFVEREQKAGVLAVADGPSDRALIVLAALGRLDEGEGVAGIENRVAKQEVERAVIRRRSALGNDFQPSAAGTREARGIRVVVDLYFLNCRGSHARTVGLDAIDDERDAVGSGRIVVQKARHGRDVVLIEDGYAVERVAVDDVRVLVIGALGSDQRHGISGGDRNVFGRNRDLHDDANCSLTLAGQAGVDAGVAESLGMKLESVIAGRDIVEPERAGVVRDRLSNRFTVGADQRHFSLGDRGPRGVEKCPRKGARRRRRLLLRDTHLARTLRAAVESLRRQSAGAQKTQSRDQHPNQVNSHAATLQKYLPPKL